MIIDTMPIDTMPIDAISIDTMPIDTMPIDTMPIDTMPIDTMPNITVLSFDVGITNLSYCIISKQNNNINIIDWNLINLNENKVCCKCGKKAYYANSTNYYCNKHAKNIDIKFEEYCVACSDDECCNYITKTKKKCDKYANYIYNNKSYCMKHCKQVFENNNKITKIKHDYNSVIYTLILELEKRSELLNCDDVIIENQPSMKNPKMKSIALTLYNYYMIRGMLDNNIKHVKFVSPSNKLKYINKSDIKSTYKENKKNSIDYCSKFICEFPQWEIFFNCNAKKDDLSDSLIQCLHYIKTM